MITIKKHFGGLLATVKAIMEKVDIMEKKSDQKDKVTEIPTNKEEEIQEIYLKERAKVLLLVKEKLSKSTSLPKGRKTTSLSKR